MSKKSIAELNQVRIIGGQFKRRLIDFIDLDGLRPTPDRLRETLFNWLMADIHDARVLDACAGSGVLGFEAVSRGAQHTTFIECNTIQYQQLIKTAQTLQVACESVSMYCGEAQKIIPTLTAQAPFDLVFLDPPYKLNLWLLIVTTLLTADLINSDSLIYIEADQPLSLLLAEAVMVDNISYHCEVLKDKKVGQIYAGLVVLSHTA